MAKLLAEESKWFNQIEPFAFFNEEMFTELFIQSVDRVYPDYFCIPFNDEVTIAGKLPSYKPDLALVRQDLTAWIVVEVELHRHSGTHPSNQINTFRKGTYTADHAKSLFDNKPEDCALSLSDFETLVIDSNPRVLVVIDDDVKDWVKNLKLWNQVDVLIYQIYTTKSNEAVFRFDGFYPYMKKDYCLCIKDSKYNLLKIEEPAYLLDKLEDDQESFLASAKGKLYKWNLKKEGNELYIEYTGKLNPFSAFKHLYQLYYEDETEKFIIEPC